ncbi:UNVERIFIED_CONTAM: ABC transporter A family member 1 [Sesamum indicum]
MRSSRRQLKAMLRKNWLLKIRHPFVTCAEVLLPTIVMLLLIAVRTRVDTQLHPPQPYIRKDMLVEVGKSDKSAPFDQILELLCAKREYLAFAPDTSQTRMMINVLSIKFPLLKVGNEISFKLPIASSSSFESMFREIERCMQRSNLNFETPDCGDSTFLGIESYGISVTTLEEVFLRVAGGDFDGTDYVIEEKPLTAPNLDVNQQSQNNASERIFCSKVCKNYIEVIGFIFSIMGKASSLFLVTTLHVIKFLSMQCCCACILSRSTFWKHSKALLIKRAVSARRDQKTIIFQLLIPAIFLLLGLLMIKLKPHPDQQSVTFTTSHFNPLLTGGGGGGPIPFDLSLEIAKEVKPTEVSSFDLNSTCQAIRETFFDLPSHTRSIFSDLEVCIGGTDVLAADKAAEISLSKEIIVAIGRWFGNAERVESLVSAASDSCGVFSEQLSEQLRRDGGIPLPVFSEWWLTKEKFSAIDSFIQSSFPGATYQSCDGLSIKYQLPYAEDLSLADVFGHMERNRNALGISEYSISQSTLETIFNHFATNS